MAGQLRDFDRRMKALVPWQQYIQAKWSSTLFEAFKDVRDVWRLAEHGSDEEKRRVDERLSDLFYDRVAPSIFRLFGDEITTNYTWDDFSSAVFEVAGLDIDRDYLVSSPIIREISPRVIDWARR